MVSAPLLFFLFVHTPAQIESTYSMESQNWKDVTWHNIDRLSTGTLSSTECLLSFSPPPLSTMSSGKQSARWRGEGIDMNSNILLNHLTRSPNTVEWAYIDQNRNTTSVRPVAFSSSSFTPHEILRKRRRRRRKTNGIIVDSSWVRVRWWTGVDPATTADNFFHPSDATGKLVFRGIFLLCLWPGYSGGGKEGRTNFWICVYCEDVQRRFVETDGEHVSRP